MAKRKVEPSTTDAAALDDICAGLEPAHAKPNEFMIPLANILGPKWNHRQIFRDIDELADSMTEHGQEEAIKVRPAGKPGLYEVVYGERRWRAFHVIAKRSSNGNDPTKIKIRCKVEQLNDRGVIVQQAIENLDRDNPHPVEEALIYERLLGPAKDGGQGMTMAAVVHRLRKPIEQITDRLELLKLCDDARNAYLMERFTHAHALLVARIPDAGMQMRFVSDILSLDVPNGEHRLMSVEQARKHVRKYFMLPLATAPFSTTDENIVPAAGACETCPHNTRTQQVLFRDLEPEQAFCVNVPCFEEKADIAWTRRSEQARANGQDVLSDADAKLVWPWAGSELASPHAAYVPLSQVSYDFEPTRTYAELVTIAESVGHVVRRAIARKPGTHTIVELVTAEDARTVVRQARECLAAVESAQPEESEGHPPDDAAPTPKGEQDATREDRWKQIQEEAQRSKREQTQQFRAAMGVFVTEVVGAVSMSLDTHKGNIVRAIAQRLAQNCLVDTAREVVSRRGLKAVGPINPERGMRAGPEAALLGFIERAPDDASILALIFELILTKDTTSPEPFVGLRDALTALGIREEDARQGRSAPEKKAGGQKAPRKRATTKRAANARAEA